MAIEILISYINIRQINFIINFRNRYHIIIIIYSIDIDLVGDPNLNLLNCEALREQQTTVAHQA